MSKKYYHKFDETAARRFVSLFIDTLLIKNNPGSLISSLHSTIITSDLIANESKISSVLPTLDPKEFLSVYMHLLLYPVLYQNLLSNKVCIALNNILTEHLGSFSLYYMNLNTSSKELEAEFNISDNNIMDFIFDGSHLSKNSLSILSDALIPQLLLSIYNVYKNKKIPYKDANYVPSLTASMAVDKIAESFSHFISMFGPEYLSAFFALLFINILFPNKPTNPNSSFFKVSLNPAHTNYAKKLATMVNIKDLLKILSNKFFVLMKVKSTENFIFEVLFQMSYFLDGDVSLNKISEHIPIKNITQFIEFTDLMYQSLPEGNISQLNSGLTSTIVYNLLEFVEKNDSKNQKEPGNEPSALTAFMESNCFAQLIVSAYLNVDKKVLDSAKGQEFVNSVKNFIKSHPHVLPEYIGGTLFYQDTNYRNEKETLNLWSECMIATENFDRLHLIVSNKFKDEEQKKKIFNLFFSMLPSQSVECVTRVNITLSKFAYADLTLIDGTYDYFKAQCMFLAATANTDAIKKKIMNEITQLHNKYNIRVGEATYKQRAHYAELANMFKAFIDVLTISQRSFGDKNKKPLALDPSIANIIIGLVSNYLLTSYNTKSKEFNMLANLFANEICTNYPELPFEVVYGPNAQDYQSVSNDFYKQLYSAKDGLEACMNTVQKYYFSKYHDGHAIYAHIIGEIAYETPFFIKDYPKPAMKTIGMFIAKMIEIDLFRGIQLDVFKVILALNTVEVKNDSVPFYHSILSALGEKLKTAPAYSIKRDKFILGEIIKKGNLANLIPGLTATLNGSSESENESKNSPSNQVVPVDGLVKPKKPFNFVNPSDVNLPERITIDMSFILNNVSNNNVQESAHNLRMILNNVIDNGSGVLETLAKLFTQRIKQDSNYHVVYRDLIYAMNVKPLLDDITYNVLTSVSTLFSHSASSSKDKKLLKTLANWLGLSLIAKNKLLTNEELPIRELLLDSWNKGYTQSSVPFVCTIIEYTKDSSLFQYPNLWTKSIIELLVEMKETGDNTKDANKWALKTTFNVEVMFKNLKLSMLDVEKSNWLSNPDSLDILTGKISHESNDIKNSEKMLQNLIQRPVMEMMMAQKVQQVNNGVANINIDEQIISPKPQQQMNMQMPQQQQMNMQMPQQQAQLPHNDAILTSLQGNTMFVANPDLQVAFQMAIAKSVREILVTVVEKSSTTAAMTARALVAKDFATEANPELYKATCVKTARQLAKSSTYINSASMLRSNIVNTTRQLCGNVMILLQNVEEELVTAIDDNIDMAISIIENAAMDKATTLVLDAIIPDISFRQHHVQRRSGQAFHYVPEGVVTSASIPLPDAFKLNPEGITKQQLSVYESLENMPLGTDMHLAMNNSNNSSSTMVPQPLANNVSSQPMNAKSSSASDRQSLLQQLNKVKNSNQQESVNMAALPMMNNQPPPGFGQRPMQATSVQGTPLNQPQQMMMPEAMNEQMQRHQNTMFMTFEQQLVSSMNMIDAVVGYIYDSRDRNLDDVITVVDAFVIRIISGIANSKQLNAIALAVSQTCVSRMFEFRGNQLVVVVFTTLIQKLCIMSPVAKKDVNWWLVHSQNSLKMDTTCLLILNKIGVLETSQFDTLLSGLLKSDIKNTIDFTLDVLKNLFELEPFEISKTQLAYTITLLKQVEDDFYKEKIDAFFNSKEYASLTVQSEDEIHTVLFTEWANLLETYQPSDLVCRKFLVELMQNLPTTEKFISFLNMALKISYDAFLVSDPQSNVFKAIDALAYLVVQLVIYQNSAMGVNRSKFLSVVLVAFQSKLALHANDKQFNGRPFFRFVSVILSYWQQLYVAGFDMVADENVRTELLEFNKELYTVITDMLHICQPMFFPSFSFSWLGLFSHRMYLPIMLKFEGEAKNVMWKKLNLLLIDLFRFLKVFGKNGDESIKVLNAGILRIILFVANDCPEFLIENHYVLMNDLPGDFKQIRNIINSCIPQGKIFPDALNQFVNIDVIDESGNFSPKALVSPVNDLGSLKKPLDSFLRIPSSSLNRNIMNQIALLNNGDAKENFKVINAIVTHSVILAGDELLSTSKQVILNESSSYFNLISNLITSNVVENRAVVMNVIDSLVNHLRFPNTQTYFVWYVLTTIFNIDLNDKELTKKLNWNEESLAIAQEMILRSLLDRLLVSKPHPWGCVMTIMTILKKIDSVDELKFVNKSKNGNESVYGLMTAMKSAFESANKEVEVQ